MAHKNSNLDQLKSDLSLVTRGEIDDFPKEIWPENREFLFGMKYADMDRIEDFIRYMETKDLNKIEAKSLLSLILHSLNLIVRFKGNGKEFWNRIFELLLKDRECLEEHQNYWGGFAFSGGFLVHSVITTDLKEYIEIKSKLGEFK